jgi:Ca2+-binding RTX toxin-like protein
VATAEFDAELALFAAAPAAAQTWNLNVNDSHMPVLGIVHGAGADVLNLATSGSSSAFIGDLGFTGSLTLSGSGTTVVLGVDSGAVTITGSGAKTVVGAAVPMIFTATGATGALDLTGSSGADTFNFGTRLDAGDVVDGAGGVDELNATIPVAGLGSAAVPVPLHIDNMETFNLTLAAGAVGGLDAGDIDVDQVNIDGGGGGSTLSVVDIFSASTWDASLYGGAVLLAARESGGGAVDLIGGDFSDVLRGSGTADILAGGLGNDTLQGGSGGADDFRFDTAPNAVINLDTILDFQPSLDDIVLDATIFAALAAPANPLPAGNFFTGTAILSTSGDADDYIKYNTETGAIYYDSNGNVAGGLTLFAVLQPDPVSGAAPLITNNDFVVVA